MQICLPSNHSYESPTNPNPTMTRKSEVQKEKEIELERRERVLTVAAAMELFTMGLCRARWEGAAEFWFGILEVRLKWCSFRLLALCIPGQLFIFH